MTVRKGEGDPLLIPNASPFNELTDRAGDDEQLCSGARYTRLNSSGDIVSATYRLGCEGFVEEDLTSSARGRAGSISSS
jgi:hypothetical protein